MYLSRLAPARSLLLPISFRSANCSHVKVTAPLRHPGSRKGTTDRGTSGGKHGRTAATVASVVHTMQVSASQEDHKPQLGGEQSGWRSLGTRASELRLEWTLPTGQSFRWRKTGEDPLEFTGVVGQRAVRLRQLADDVQYQVIARVPSGTVVPGQPGGGAAAAGSDPEAEAELDAATLRDYFNLSTSLADLAPGWCSACPRYAAVHPLLPGARMLRQDPVECLFQFICSSNNHISRIHGMVERLCRKYGTPLEPLPAAAAAEEAGAEAGAEAAKGPADIVDGAEGKAAEGKAAAPAAQQQLALRAFPTLEQLAAATEDDLRADGFGYRAKYITGSVDQLLGKPGGGAAWLLGLRDVPYEEAAEALCTLPGIGPKVAACICLFSLDKHQAIPVDTHVWALACKYYTPQLRGKSLTKKIHGEVQAAFVARFGTHAGWAHNTLFISELASTRDKVTGIAGAGSSKAAGKRKAMPSGSSEGSEGSVGSDGQADSRADSGGSSYSSELKKKKGKGKSAADAYAGAAAAAAVLPPPTPADADGTAGRKAGGRPRRRVARKAQESGAE